MMVDLRSGLMRLVLDPQFAVFERLANRSNLFRIVGRTHTETWHSMLLAWLLDPQGSHGLGDFALRRLLFAAAESPFAPTDRRSSLISVAAFGDFASVAIAPNERTPKEEVIKVGDKSGRLDVVVSGIKAPRSKPSEAVLLIEQKVFAPPDDEQCRFYMSWLDQQHADKLQIPLLLAPMAGPDESPLDDDRWFVLDYQSLHDNVLVPALEHPDISASVRPLIEQYVDALRIPMDGTKLAISQEEKDLATDLYKRHEQTFNALFEVLTTITDNPQLQALVAAANNAGRLPIGVKADGSAIMGASGAEFLRNVVGFLDNTGRLPSVTPFQTGTKRYLIATVPKHVSGKDFESPTEIHTKGGTKVFVETNASRSSSLKYGIDVLKKAGFKTEIVNA
jgi:hypothetical protein